MDITEIRKPCIHSEGITLRLPNISDMGFIRWLWGDVETMMPVGGPIYLNDEESKAWFSRMIDPGSPTDLYFLIINMDNNPVGEISFHRLNMGTMTADLNIKIANNERGKGYAQKALKIFLDFYFNQFGGKKINDTLASKNLNGKNMLLKFGFEQDPKADNLFQIFMIRETFNNLYKISRV